MQFNFQEFLTLTFTLFAVIDVVGSVPMLISMKEKMGGINAWKVTLISGALMVLFFFIGKPFLNILGVDIKSFAVYDIGSDTDKPYSDLPCVAIIEPDRKSFR